MIKKNFISFLILIIISSNILFSYRVSANSNPFVPPSVQGYDEALFTSFMTGIAAVTAGVMHTTDTINKMRDFAVDNWPAFKDSFSNAVIWTGDQIIIAGNWIENVLMDSMEKDDILNTDEIVGTYDKYLSVDIYHYLYVSGGYKFKVSYDGETSETALIRLGWTGNCLRGYNNACVDDEQVEAMRRLFDSIIEYPTMSKVIAYLGMFGISVGLVDVNSNDLDLVVSDSNIYNQVDNWFRQREAYENGLTLGIPRSAPYTSTGRALEYDDTLGTLTLDSVPYTGEVNWKTLANLGLNIPSIPLMLDGLPVYHLGDGVFVDQNGNVVPTDRVGDITVGSPDIVVDSDNVYVRTENGDLVNLKTGEIISTGELDVPTIPVVPTIPIEGVGEFAPPSSTIDWNPLLMAGQGLTEKFPFSIPFDFYRQLKVFDVEPKAPTFDINVNNYFAIDGHQQSMKWELSFEQFDAIAAIFRWFILILFDIGLILAIRRIMPE